MIFTVLYAKKFLAFLSASGDEKNM